MCIETCKGSDGKAPDHASGAKDMMGDARLAHGGRRRPDKQGSSGSRLVSEADDIPEGIL